MREGGQITVLHMAGQRYVYTKPVPQLHVVMVVIALGMEVVKGANTRTVPRVFRENPNFVLFTVEGTGVFLTSANDLLSNSGIGSSVPSMAG